MKKVLLTLFLIIQCSFLGATIINVPSDYYTIQAAVDAAAEKGDTILVQPGTYREVDIEYKAVTLGSLFLTTGDSSYIEQTIIDGDHEDSPVSIIDDGVIGAFPTTICGFTITNGTGTWEPVVFKGGGIYIETAFVIVRNNIIEGNTTSPGWGTAICCENGELYCEDNIIRYNEGYKFNGGAIYTIGCYLEVRRCDISYNTHNARAAGLSLWETDFIIEDCTFNNNEGGEAIYIVSAGEGCIRNCQISSNLGGIYINLSYVDLYNLLITDNIKEDWDGAGVMVGERSIVSLVNCTIANNSADEEYGGGLASGYTGFPTSYVSLTNCILYDNYPNEIRQENADIEIDCCDIQGGEADIVKGEGTFTWGDGNIDADPLFVGGNPFSYELSSSSPCINAGTPDTTGLHLPLTDLAGNPRVLYDRIDMGAYECKNVSVDPGVSVVEGVSLYQNSPNPFGNMTEISFTVKDFSHINDYSVSIYNTKGQLVRTFAGKSNTEVTKIAWDGTDGFGKQTSPGVYLYKLEYGEQEVVKKMIKLY